MSQRSDPSLVRRAKAGDEEALAALFARYGCVVEGRIRRLLPGHLLRRVSVADVMQEVRLAAFRGFAEFDDRGDGSLRNWLLTIADNKLQDAIRRHAGTKRRDVGREVSRGRRRETGQFPGFAPSPSEAAIGSETAARIRAAMATIRPDYRDVLRLVRDEGLTLREAAARMGRSREATKKLYGRALCRLKEAYTRLGGEIDGA